MVPGTSALSALGIVVVLGLAAHAALPYLPLTGPPTMRIQLRRSVPTASKAVDTKNASPSGMVQSTDAGAGGKAGQPNATNLLAGVSSAGANHLEAGDEKPLDGSAKKDMGMAGSKLQHGLLFFGNTMLPEQTIFRQKSHPKGAPQAVFLMLSRDVDFAIQ